MEAEIANLITTGNFNVSLDKSQVVIDQGLSTDDIRYQLNLLFFPTDGNELSSQTEAIIVTVFNQRRITLSVGPFQVPFAPYTGTNCFPISAFI